MSTRRPPDGAGLTTIRSVGGLVPPDLLARIVAGTDLPGLTGDDFRLELGVTPREAANRAWSVLTGAWRAYRDALAARPEGDRATGLTRDKWLAVLLRELGFGRVPPTPAGGITADGRSFPVSHEWDGLLPVHLLGRDVDLDRKTPGLAGAAERAPHAMVQELLNRSDDHLWALLANGGTLRLLRDSASLVGQAYVEFDLQSMFDGEVFSDFAVLYLLCHESRFAPVDSELGPEDCWLERWRADAVETGARALGALRKGVKSAIEELGTGFLRHPANAGLRERIVAGNGNGSDGVSLADYHRALLRLVYRLLFCFVAEDRGLLLDPDADPATQAARQRYTEWFSTSRLRGIATRRLGTRHADLWQALSLVIDGLGQEQGCPELALPGIGGLFEHGPADVVTGQQLANDALLAALRHLCVVQPPGGGPKRKVDYRNLGAEELGSIYESLLELVPRYDPGERRFSLVELSGNDRKKTGSYYTPTSLIDCLLDSALDPLLDQAEQADDPEQALLALTVCDPACGSGHFLVAAARRIAARLARVRVDGGEPTVLDSQAAMHEVVGRCIYGVDINPLAAELAKVSLWLEALEPGRPLSFLDAHIKVGNALLGTTPALLAEGIPDDAFKPLEGDDRKTVSSLRAQNRKERSGQEDLFSAPGLRVDNRAFAQAAGAIDAVPGRSLADIHLAEKRQRDLEHSPALRHARLIADAWCAAFVMEKRPDAPRLTQATLERWQKLDLDQLDGEPGVHEVQALADRYRFFHWHLEFPRIFTVPSPGPAGTDTGWTGGFDCVLGNPPWERIKLQEQEFFAARDPDIAAAPNAAARKTLIKALKDEHPMLHTEFTAAKRQADGESHFVRNGGRYPLCGRGDINTYAIFAETDRALLDSYGRIGVILPTGIATDATTQHFFKNLVTRRSLVSLYDFENAKPIFDDVHRSFKFCLLTLSGGAQAADAAEFAFFARDVPDLTHPDARFVLTPEEITLLNPNTGTCPVFRTRRDAELTLAIYRHVSILVRRTDPQRNPWDVSLTTMFHMSNDSHLFHTAEQLEADGWLRASNRFADGTDEMLPLHEGKMGHQFDHRFASFDGVGDNDLVPFGSQTDPGETVTPRYWVYRDRAGERQDRRQWSCRTAMLGHRRVARNNDERTSIAAVLPWGAASYGWILSSGPDAAGLVLLVACYNSFPLDYCLRNSFSQPSIPQGTFEQVPVLAPDVFDRWAEWDPGMTVAEWIRPRVLELTYTAWDMEPFARDLGDDGPPFRWDEDRRAVLRAELDGAFFHLYGIDKRHDVDYILGTFPIVHRNDIAEHGEERTRRLVLDAYDRLDTAIDSEEPFVSTLDPPPGNGLRHPAR